jgi:REP element-mobilizing transposase RayT
MPEWTVAAPQASGRATAADSASQLAVDMGLQLPVDESLSGLARTPHALYNLTYAIVWAPKFPKTRLAGDITGNLGEWIRHIALSYDWRVERVEVRPECVVVVVNCPPEIAPERVINTLKRTTSERVFVEFPNIAADHPGGDFWAPGYLLLGAGQMVTPQQINDFLAFTRREQGLRR